MSVLGELDLLGPRAHGAACGEAVLKAVAEDFQVDEVLDIPLSGEGEHLWLWVEKRGLNTEEAARRLGRAAGVQQKNVSYAGLKDRQALTRQWFSLHLPGKADPDLGAAEGADLRILRRTRHSRKLQRGAHAANGFTLRLTGLRAERALLDARLERIAADGVPNYFGLQRFGHGGGWPWPGASRRSAAGWRRRAWRTNGASCGSPSRGWRGIIPNLMFCNWNSSCRPVVSPP